MKKCPICGGEMPDDNWVSCPACAEKGMQSLMKSLAESRPVQPSRGALPYSAVPSGAELPLHTPEKKSEFLSQCVKEAEKVSIRRLMEDRKIPQIHLDSEIADRLNRQFAAQSAAISDTEERLKFELLPPLFPDFLIVVEQAKRLGEDVIHVRYATPETVFLTYYLGGKRILCFTGEISRAKDDGTSLMSMHVFSDRFASEGTAYCASVVRMIRLTWLSVSRYMLYYSPDLEYIDNAGVPAPPHKPAPGKKENSGNRLEILLRSKKRIYHIPDGAEKAFRSPPQYSKLSWQVRGHYRRMGAKKEWRYVPPTIAHRHGAKKRTPEAPRYRIEEES